MKYNIFILVTISFFLTKCKDYNQSKNILIQEQEIILKEELTNVINTTHNTFLNNGRRIKIKHIVNNSGESVPLNSLFVNDKSLLILRISDRYCSDCINFSLEMLKDIEKKYNKLNCIIIGDFTTPNAKQFFSKGKNLEIFEAKFDLIAEEAVQPYFFILKEDMVVNDCFFPILSLPQYNNNFILALKKYNL